jgi:hypothetical protein
MRSRILLVVAAAVLAAVVPSVHAKKHRRSACNVNDCAVVAALGDICDCGTADTHGAYVKCVAHAGKQLAQDDVLPRRCHGKLVSAAAHSVCGRADSVVCLTPVSTCDANGFCVNDSSVECVDDTDCGTQCSVMSSDDCDNSNGIESDAPSCGSDSCFSPSGAFLG